MKRRVAGYSSAVLLALLIAAGILSEFRTVYWTTWPGIGRGEPQAWVILWRGSVFAVFWRSDRLIAGAAPGGWRVMPVGAGEQMELWRAALPRPIETTKGVSFVVPLWCPAILAAAGAVWGLWRPRASAGACRGCGYDLTGIPGVCPECGAERNAPCGRDVA